MRASCYILCDDVTGDEFASTPDECRVYERERVATDRPCRVKEEPSASNLRTPRQRRHVLDGYRPNAPRDNKSQLKQQQQEEEARRRKREKSNASDDYYVTVRLRAHRPRLKASVKANRTGRYEKIGRNVVKRGK
ncbi:unnamed protein product [Trichogramma brassicae]|uniref:Uncharacterized protein n=1 Tax=Trichogramma brassicae TaxID=86971 RepID=A0A6H5IER8_9HYME|nr:unnamed protein product [Trichogramma brassicae]